MNSVYNIERKIKFEDEMLKKRLLHTIEMSHFRKKIYIKYSEFFCVYLFIYF